ncbi:MAG: excinuclease ABC subunit UvrC [Oscillospiraceae bacterium]|nr:excinuclease ABC subunit UvrC [Oscillospiraceae bacterium]
MNERLPYLREKTSKLTVSPGVYRMRDKSGGIIYIGKAKNLKNRVTSYFRENPDHTPKVAKMVSHVYDYDFIVTDSEYEALVLECSMIKQHMPKYNILLKDDKGYSFIKISDEEYPRITAEMQKKGEGTFLGPYTSTFVTRQTVEEANKVFSLPSCKRVFPRDFGKYRPCLNFHIKQCMGVCRGKTDPEEYRSIVRQAEDYIRNGSEASVETLTEQMNIAAENLDFELAARLRDRISAIKRAADDQKIIHEDMKDTDIIAMSQNGESSCAAVLMYRGGRLFDRAEYDLGAPDSEENMLEDFVLQYYSDPTKIPREIIVEEELPNGEMVERLLREKCGRAVDLFSRKRGKGLKLIMMAKANAEESLAIKVGRSGKEIAALEALGKLLGLPEPPVYIEAYDISNLGSSSMVAGMVVFENGRPLKKAYKRFSIKETAIQNDYASMREVLERRFRHYQDASETDEGFSRMPDLILLDGGKGQVNAVEPILREMGIDVPLFGMVKDNNHRTRAIATSGAEISISGTKSAFMLVTRIQDEVHRFSITYQRKKHGKQSYEMGITQIKGIGEKKALKLFTAFKTRDALKKASAEEIAKAMGINHDLAEQVREYIQNEMHPAN